MISLKIALTFGLAYVIICTIGCSEGYENGWSWDMTTENGERETAVLRWKKSEVRVDDISSTDKHEKCKERHYIDPYTKLEYCLPLDFENVNQLHFYRVKK
jgi:hypothetical protein